MAAKKFSLKDSPIFKSTVVPKPEGEKPELEPEPEKEISLPESGPQTPVVDQEKVSPPQPVREQKEIIPPPAAVKEESAVVSTLARSSVSIRKMLGLSRKTVGLDISADKVIMVELEHTATGTRLNKFALASISGRPEGEEREGAIIKALREVVQTSGINPRDVIVAIPGNLTNHILLTFPPMPKKELHSALYREVKQHTTTSPQDTIVSYLPLGEISQKGIQKQKVLLIMTSKSEVMRFLSLMKESGISPAAISTTQIAFYNLWQKMDSGKKSKATALVDIKGSVVTINICRDNQLYLSRTIQVPGRENLEVFLGRLRVELDRSFLYYKQQFRGETVEKIFLSEESKDVATIAEVLSENLRMEVEEFDPLKSVSVRKEFLQDIPPSPAVLTTAIGLAIERSTRKRKQVNLLPEEIQERTQVIAKRVSLGVSGAALVTLLLLVYWGLGTTAKSYRQLLADQKERLLQIEPILKKYETFKKKEQLHQKEFGLVEKLTRGRPPLSLILQDLSNIVPKAIFFRELSISEGDSITSKNWHLTIRGEIVKGGISGWRGSLTALLNSLKKSSFFREVVLEPLQEDSSSDQGMEEKLKTMSFTIRCVLN